MQGILLQGVCPGEVDEPRNAQQNCLRAPMACGPSSSFRSKSTAPKQHLPRESAPEQKLPVTECARGVCVLGLEAQPKQPIVFSGELLGDHRQGTPIASRAHENYLHRRR